MAKCRHFVNGSSACAGGIYTSQSPVRSGGKVSYHIKDSVVLRQFCNGEPMQCPYNPDGRGYQSNRTKQAVMKKAYETDKRELDEFSQGFKKGFPKFLWVVAGIAVVYFLFIRN